jgi:uncharacterized membrane protein YbaN (DUF454 family)
MKRILLITLGWTSVILGVIGIFLPILPTTPFLLLASWCFARSSKRFHDWLTGHPKLGPIVLAWENGTGIPLKIKIRVITVLWLSMSLSIYLIDRLYAGITLGVIGTCVSIYLIRLPTANNKTASQEDESSN